MNNILILGSTGMLGSTFKKYFDIKRDYEVSSLNRSDIDLSRCSFNDLWKKIKEKVVQENCKYVLNCAGVIKQGDFSTPDMIKVNSVIPYWLSEICQILEIELVHVTTDCVYDGSKGRYSEEDKHTATDVYGISKSLGEPDTCTVIRTSIIGEEERGFSSLLEWVRSNEGKTINGFKNHIWNGVTCLQLAKIVDKTIKENSLWSGVRSFHSRAVDKFHLLEMIKEAYELNLTVCPVNAAESCDRSLSSIRDFSDYEIPKLYDQIKESRDFYLAHEKY